MYTGRNAPSNTVKCTAEKVVVASNNIVYIACWLMIPTTNAEEYFRTGLSFPLVVYASVMICQWNSGSPVVVPERGIVNLTALKRGPVLLSGIGGRIVELGRNTD